MDNVFAGCFHVHDKGRFPYLVKIAGYLNGVAVEQTNFTVMGGSEQDRAGQVFGVVDGIENTGGQKEKKKPPKSPEGGLFEGVVGAIDTGCFHGGVI